MLCRNFGLCYFTIYDPAIYDLTMYDSCVNYPNYLKLCRKNYVTEKLNFAKKNTEFVLYANKHFSVTSHVI